SLNDGAIAARHATQKTHDKGNENVRRKGEREVAEAISGDRADQNRLTPDRVGDSSPEGFPKKGAHGVSREDQRDLPSRGLKRLGVERQQRHDDAETEQIDEHYREQRGKRSRRDDFGARILVDGIHGNKGLCGGSPT